ncbi:MAG TPA: extracellular solute-binding protein [Anaerolineae bacterium]|nr:extracellular solute-binding protein [Anaerolineae bacterium]
MSRKTIFLFVTLVLSISLLSAAVLAAPPSQEGGQEYTVQADDWVSKLAEKFYGDPLAYAAIVEATNAKAAADNSYAPIDNPDVIEVGQKLFIPTAQEASALLGQEVPFLSGDLTIYSGRGEELVGPLIDQFEQETGLNVEVRYGSTAEMAATILEEGANSPADVYYGQDAGALGALAKAGRLAPLPEDALSLVDPRFRSAEGLWVGTSGRARVVVYNTEKLSEADLPDDIFGFCAPEWKGRLGWAPTNGSFQAFVTALRVIEGEDRAREWLSCIQANEPLVFPGNAPIVEAVSVGEIDAGFVNHYYLFQFLAERGESFPVRNYHPRSGDVGAMVNIAGVGIVDTSDNKEAAEAFVRFLLRESSQQYFNTETNEYPLSANLTLNPLLVPISQIQTPNVDLTNLDDLDGTLQLLQELGIL